MQTQDRRGTARALLRVLEVLAWTAFFGFAALFLALRFWLLPQVERYQGDVVAALSRATGLPVKIGALQADWDGLRPRLTVSDLRVYDRNGREALVLPSVEHVVSWTTLPARKLRLHTLAIEGPRLTVRRDAQGRIHVAGIELAAGEGAGRGRGNIAEWILGQREIVIRNAEVDWVDEQRGAPPLGLRALQFRLRNRGEVHQVGLSAQPPRALGARLELRASLIGESAAELEAWNGRVYAELGATDLAGWRPWVDYPVPVRSGQGALRLWATFGAGKLVDATADLALAGVAARLGEDLPELQLASVTGRVQGRGTAKGYEFGVRRLALAPVAGMAMQGTTFRASWEAAQPGRGSASAELIELAPLAQLAEFLPLPPELRKLLAELAPRGRLLEAGLDWTGELARAAGFRARARFEGLGMNPWRAIPGFDNLSGRLDATEAKGSLVLAAQRVEIDLPRVFPEPRVRVGALSGEVGWERGAAGHTLRLSSLAFANADFAGTASGSYATAAEGPGSIDLSANLLRFEGASLQKYLPLPALAGEKTRAWLARSIRGGQASDVRLRLRGNLRDFPFEDPALGEFEVVAQVRNGTVAFADTWPALEEFAGELRFERRRMEITGRSARSLGLALSGARAVIPSLRAPATLSVKLDAAGPSAAFLDYVRRSPVQRTVGGLPEGADAAGNGTLRLQLELPLAELARSKVAGEYRFSGNTLQLGTRLPPVTRAAGSLEFTEASIRVRDLAGRFAGGPLRVTGGTQRGGSVLLSASGAFTVDGLGTLLDERVRPLLKGGAPYSGSVRLARGAGPRFTVESSLAGVSVDLPQPLGKPAGEARPLRASLVQTDEGERDRISLAYGRSVRAELLRSREAGAMALERSAVAFNQPAGGRLRLPERPVRLLVYGTLERLDLEQWLALGARGGGSSEATAYELRVGTLDAFGRRMQDIALKARLQGGGWQASLDSPDIAGNVTYDPAGGAKLVARMARFSIPPETPGTPAARPARDLPALDLVADAFSLRGKQLGRVEIVARHDGPDWRVDRLAMVNPEGTLTAKGLWRTGAAPRTTLEADIATADVGRFLDRVGHPGLVRRGSVKTMRAELSWSGDPTTIDYPSLSGTIQLHAENGQFLEIDPGIGKLISLMSLQMLPRRITLDFRDVFSKGFQWDTINATAKVAQGVLETTDFTMSGGAAVVAMQGKVDLARETQDLRVRVVPSLDGTASTVAWIFVSPVVGLSTLLAQKVLKNPIGQMFAREYGITGSWDDPEVKIVGIVPNPATVPAGD